MSSFLYIVRQDSSSHFYTSERNVSVDKAEIKGWYAVKRGKEPGEVKMMQLMITREDLVPQAKFLQRLA